MASPARGRAASVLCARWHKDQTRDIRETPLVSGERRGMARYGMARKRREPGRSAGLSGDGVGEGKSPGRVVTGCPGREGRDPIRVVVSSRAADPLLTCTNPTFFVDNRQGGTSYELRATGYGLVDCPCCRSSSSRPPAASCAARGTHAKPDQRQHTQDHNGRHRGLLTWPRATAAVNLTRRL
jgi:hypothetical protein